MSGLTDPSSSKEAMPNILQVESVREPAPVEIKDTLLEPLSNTALLFVKAFAVATVSASAAS